MKKLLIGCGVFVAIVMVVLVGVGFFVVQWVQKALPEAERFERLESVLLERHGEADAWVPPLDGAYDPDRIARFVRIREQMQARTAEIAPRFDELARPDREPRRGWLEMIGGTREFVTVIGSGMGLLVLADSLLIEAEMGKGEFAHYNLIALHGVLGIDVEAYLAELTDSEDRDDARKALREMLVEYERDARRLLRAQIDNALDALEREARGASLDPERAAWRDLLGHERERVGGPLPLTDPVPPGFAAVIEPWRPGLEVSRPNSVGALLCELPLLLRSEQRSGRVTVSF